MSAPGDFYASGPPTVQAPYPTPKPHELRVEFLRPPERQTRWRGTVTTLSPWIKVPVSVFLVFYQLIRIVRAIDNGTFLGGIYLAWELTEVVFYYGVVALLLRALWAGGKPDRRRIEQ